MFQGGSTEIVFVYNSQNDLDKQSLAYISVFSDNVKKIDVQNRKLKRAFLEELSAKLGLGFTELVNHENASLKSIEYYLHLNTPEQYIDLLEEHPNYLKTPILIHDNKAQFIEKETDLLELTFL